MSGVYDEKMIYCPVEQKETLHATGWESEEPEITDIQCTSCYGRRLVSGPTVIDGRYRRLLRPEHRLAYLEGKRQPRLSARERAEQEMDLR